MSGTKKPTWPWTESWTWATGICLTLIITVPANLMRVGICVDGINYSYCEEGPALGYPFLFVLDAFAGIAILYCGFRLVQIARLKRMKR